MPMELLPPLALGDWWETRDRLHLYARLIGQVRQKLSPREKHWSHATLRTTAVGLTTTPIPAGHFTMDLSLDLTTHLASIKSSRGDWHDVVLDGQSPQMFLSQIRASLEELDLHPKLSATLFQDDEDIEYDEEAVERFWQALSQIDIWLKEFKSSFRGETGPVQLFPHHFDLALMWLTGRLTPEQDPEKPESADEQVTFGFATGDEYIEEPYFYNGVYPWPPGIDAQPLPKGAFWHSEGFQGSVMSYEKVRLSEDPKQTLMMLWQAHRDAARKALGL